MIQSKECRFYLEVMMNTNQLGIRFQHNTGAFPSGSSSDLIVFVPQIPGYDDRMDDFDVSMLPFLTM